MPAPNPSQWAFPMINSKSLPLQDLPLPAVGFVPTHTLTLVPVTLPLPQGPCRSSSHFKYTRTQPDSSVNLTHPSDLSTAPDSPKEVGALIISLRGLRALGDSLKSVCLEVPGGQGPQTWHSVRQADTQSSLVEGTSGWVTLWPCSSRKHKRIWLPTTGRHPLSAGAAVWEGRIQGSPPV